jgi:transmembrane sensor
MGSDRITIEAAQWRLRLEAQTADPTAFQKWLDRDSRHGAQYAALERAWSCFDELADEPGLGPVRQALRARVAHRRKRRRLVGNLAAAAASVLVVSLGLYLGFMPRAQILDAPPHRLQSLQLADGSRVILDAGARLRVRYSPFGRDLTLDRGRARFVVAHERIRRFVVQAGDRRVIATGTAFDVDVEGDVLTVSLLQGHVTVLPTSAASDLARPVDLLPGQQLAAAATGDVVRQLDPMSATGWAASRLVFTDTPLKIAVDRVNRYATAPIVLTDESLEALRVSGVFNSGDVAAFADAVTALLPVTTEVRSGGVIALRPCGGDQAKRPYRACRSGAPAAVIAEARPSAGR